MQNEYEVVTSWHCYYIDVNEHTLEMDYQLQQNKLHLTTPNGNKISTHK